ASIGLVGTLGVIGGGWYGDMLTRRGQAAGRLNAATLAMIFGATGAVLYPLQATAGMIVPFFMLAILGGFMVVGTGAAALMDIMPNRLRGQATAIYLFVVSITGVGLGPTAVAVFTDYVFGDAALVAKSLAIVPPTGFVLAAICFWAARKPFARINEQ
ncbi:MAG: hypothetical protein ACR2QI_08725, partial [Woeseiaceae bacterium]